MNIDASALLTRVRQQKPLVHHITNWVTIYDCAQAVKALGASPVMAHAPEEVAEMAQLASALVLNIGTLTRELVEAMKKAAQAANRQGIPVLLDACGAGATRLRDEQCRELMESARIDVLKGNASEIARLAGAESRTRGVDAGPVTGDILAFARQLAISRNATVVVTGKEDVVTDGRETWLVANGHEMLTHVVGTGCMAASLIGTFAAVEPKLVCAAAAALACYGIAAEQAAPPASGPASFKQLLLDCLYRLDAREVHDRQAIRPA